MENPVQQPSSLEAFPTELLSRIGELLVPPFVEAGTEAGPSWKSLHTDLRNLSATSRRLYNATSHIRYHHVGLWKAQNAAAFLLHLSSNPHLAAHVSQISVCQLSYSESLNSVALLPSRLMVQAYRLAYRILSAIGPMVHDEAEDRRYLQLHDWHDPDDGLLPNGTYADYDARRRPRWHHGLHHPVAAGQPQSAVQYFSFGHDYLNGVDAVRNAILCCCPNLTHLWVKGGSRYPSDGLRAEYPVLCEGREQYHRSSEVQGLRIGLPGRRLEDLRLWNVSGALPDLPNLRRLDVHDIYFSMRRSFASAPSALSELRVVKIRSVHRGVTPQDVERICNLCPSLEVLNLWELPHGMSLETPSFSFGAVLARRSDTLRSLTVHSPRSLAGGRDSGTKRVDLSSLHRLEHLKTDTAVLFGRKESGGGTPHEKETRMTAPSGPLEVLSFLPGSLKTFSLLAQDICVTDDDPVSDMEYEMLLAALVWGLLEACEEGALRLETFKLDLYEPNMGVLPFSVEETVVEAIHGRFSRVGVDFQVKLRPRGSESRRRGPRWVA